jgi:hypothetical protein
MHACRPSTAYKMRPCTMQWYDQTCDAPHRPPARGQACAQLLGLGKAGLGWRRSATVGGSVQQGSGLTANWVTSAGARRRTGLGYGWGDGALHSMLRSTNMRPTSICTNLQIQQRWCVCIATGAKCMSRSPIVIMLPTLLGADKTPW